MSGKKIIDKVCEAGVIGAGGAGFPTHVKIDAEVDTVIVNGAECEPLLRVDQELMEKKAEELINGILFVREATGAKQVVIALKEKYKKAIEKLGKVTGGHSNIDIFKLADYYPAGDEQQLVYEVTGKIVPEGGIPLMASVVVINVETVINIDSAIKGIPLTHKYVTINGAVNKPVTVYVPIGTPIKDILPLAGDTAVEGFSLIDGGPMMGKLVDFDDVIKKTTKGILVLPGNHTIINNRNSSVRLLVRRAMSVCCQCRACTDVCPRYLLGHSIEPHKIMRAISYGIDTDSDMITKAMLCCECGACDTWGCPMGISPRNINIHIKEELKKRDYKNEHKQAPDSVHLMRNYRKIPVKRLIKRLGIYQYDQAAPINEENFTPEKIILPLSQHIGAPARPVVNIGENVKGGQLVAKIPDGSLGANIHSGISGKVKSIGDSITIEG